MLTLIPGKLYKVKFNKNRWPHAKYLSFTEHRDLQHSDDKNPIYKELKEGEVIMYVDKLRHHKHLFLIDGKVCCLTSYMKDGEWPCEVEDNDTIDEWIVGPL